MYAYKNRLLDIFMAQFFSIVQYIYLVEYGTCGTEV